MQQGWLFSIFRNCYATLVSTGPLGATKLDSNHCLNAERTPFIDQSALGRSIRFG